MILVASRSVFSLFSPDEEMFQNVMLWKNLLPRTCVNPLWAGVRDGVSVTLGRTLIVEDNSPTLTFTTSDMSATRYDLGWSRGRAACGTCGHSPGSGDRRVVRVMVE